MKTELNYLRVILSVFIVLTHLLTQYAISTEPDENQIQVLYWIRNIFIVATPGFIILSVLLSTMNYREKLPENYLWNRVKFILVPYLMVGLIYAFTENTFREDTFWEIFLDSVLLGNWYGYFILVIMQFFVLNWIIFRISPKILNSKLLLFVSFIVNFAFLYSYYNHSFTGNLVDNIYPFGNETFILGWIFFYFFGAYIGANYEKVLAFIHDQIAIILLLVIISYTIFIFMNRGDYYTVTSFDYALMPLHTVGFLFILNTSTQLTGLAPNVYALISSFSFFIFLFHPIILPGIYSTTSVFADMTIIFILTSLLLTIGMCLGVGIILKQFPIFKFLIGKQPYKIDRI
ncbi:acyltransferase family protein [Salinicoccus roseus]|uniref:acyltransferase family protein n=1 Tax=Salinicoccus roseus TaxID=45670 RepID=UPI001EF581C2|nr:acyltransferase family protein [Salinicoccus roseus]MCG7331673.1 acyltransferase family protein [Salinicoccus roseus]